MGSHKSQLAFAALISCLLVGPRSSDLTVAAEPVSAAAPVATRAELVAATMRWNQNTANSWPNWRVGANRNIFRRRRNRLTWPPRRDADKLYIFLLPDALAAPANAANESALSEWRERFVKFRRAQADALSS